MTQITHLRSSLSVCGKTSLLWSYGASPVSLKLFAFGSRRKLFERWFSASLVWSYQAQPYQRRSCLASSLGIWIVCGPMSCRPRCQEHRTQFLQFWLRFTEGIASSLVRTLSGIVYSWRYVRINSHQYCSGRSSESHRCSLLSNLTLYLCTALNSITLTFSNFTARLARILEIWPS